jgi:hypothetical protein
MKQDHSPWDEKNFQAGANTDLDGTSVARMPGTYRDARNMRVADNKGNNGSLIKIGGEVVSVAADRPGADTYVCIGAIEVKGRAVTFWASTHPDDYPPIIQIGGITMVMSFQLPYKWNKKLQLSKSEDCKGGIVFDARSGGIPLQWDIAAIVEASNNNEQTYFSAFNIAAYQVNPVRPVNRAVFTGFFSVGAGAGLYGGQYWYVLRYVNANGDHTPDGPDLGPVMVPFHRGEGGTSGTFPGSDLAGVNPIEVGIATGFGVGLRFRVNNTANFDRIEILRISYNANAGIEAVPVVELAWQQAVSPGENEVYEIIDKGLVLESIATDDASMITHYIKEARAVRYINYRVAYLNVVLGGKDIQGTFVDEPGSRLHPFTKDMGKLGHADPFNHCYYRRFQSSERYGIGLVYHGVTGSKSDVQRVEDEVQMPSRRTPKTGFSADLSDAPCNAADIYNNVGPTFEVFDHDSAISKTLTADVVNIMMEGRRATATTMGANEASTYADPSWNSQAAPAGEYLDTSVLYSEPKGWLKTAWLKPLTPVQPGDYKWGLDYKVNDAVHPAGYNTPTAYAPKTYGVNHHSLGLGFTGITNIPDGTQGFSMVSTKPAGRVVVQGLFKWKLTPGVFSSGGNVPPGKEVYTGMLCIPDLAAGTLEQAVWEGLQSPGGGGYTMQCVSPLGFTSEQYGSVMSHRPEPLQDTDSSLADMLSVVRVLWDTGQMNPGNNSGGFSPTDPLPPVPATGSSPDHFVGFGSWRNQAGSWPLDNGDVPLDIAGAEEVVHESDGVLGIVRSLRVSLNVPIYTTPNAFFFRDFNSIQVKNFHEPWYVVNIILEGKHVEKTDGYVSCNHYQAWASQIGTTSGQNQVFPLADEVLDNIEGRLVDGIERYVYLLTTEGTTLRYMNKEGMTVGQYNTALLTQANQGYFTSPFSGETVEGIFQILTNANGSRSVQLVSYVLMGSAVEVRYDPRVIVKFYGDRTSSPAIATMVDAAATANPPAGVSPSQVGTQSGDNNSIPAWPIIDPSTGTGWISPGTAIRTTGLPIPFANYQYTGRYMVPFGMGFGVFGAPANGRMSVNQWSNGAIDSVRQWKIIFDLESIVPYHLSGYDQKGAKTYPNVNYVQRPYNFGSGSLADNGVFPPYADVTLYGETEQSLWRFGGIKCQQEPLTDYIVRPRIQYFAKPEFGYKEEEEQCNALIWSAKDSPAIQNSPGLKTFPVLNIEYLENSNGAGQRLFSDGGNLYAIMENQVLQILVEKTTAYSQDGTTFSLYGQDNFVGQVIPKSEFAGMPYDTWETAAEGSPFVGGAQVDALQWFDGVTSWRLAEGQVVDLSDGIYRKGLADIYGARHVKHIAAGYDKNHNEFWFDLGSAVLVFAASRGTSFWVGAYDYHFDDYLHVDNKMFGFRGLTTYELNKGDLINGKLVKSWVKVPTAPSTSRMEWIRVKVNSPRKPKRIEWYDENDTLVAWMDEDKFGPFYLKKETTGGWEHWVPRKDVTIDPGKKGSREHRRITR